MICANNDSKGNMNCSDERILVAINCIAYNHEPYIRECLEGFVMQKTNFKFVAIVHDDASTDKTADIIREYEAKYPEIIKPIYETENQYSKKDGSLRRIMNAAIDATGAKYVAMCEGDDYWADPYKLQKQVDYMEAHEDCVMCAHASNWEVNGKVERNDICHEEECDLTTDEVIREGGYYLPTASLIYRRVLNECWPSWRKKANVGDYPLQILGTLKGKLHYFPDIMSVYRYQASGSWTAANLGRKDRNLDYFYVRTRWLLDLNEDTNHKFEKAICTALFNGGYGNLFASGRVGLRQYLYVMKNGYRTKKMNHFVKEMCSRYLGFSI